MNKYKNILTALIATLLIIVCYAGCGSYSDNTIASVSHSTSTEVTKEEHETKFIEASQTETIGENSLSVDSIATKASGEGGSSQATTEVSLEGIIVEGIQESTKPSGITNTEPSISLSAGTKPSEITNIKPPEVDTKAQLAATKPALAETTAHQRPTEAPTMISAQSTTEVPAQAPAQSTTDAVKSTEAPLYPPVQTATTASKPTEATTQAKPAYNPDYVILETTRQLKAAGYECIPEYLNRYLSEGRITQEEYNAWYPTDGAGWFEHSLYNVTFGLTIEDDIYELVESCKYLCVDNIFYIEYIGENEYGGYTFRVYR